MTPSKISATRRIRIWSHVRDIHLQLIIDNKVNYFYISDFVKLYAITLLSRKTLHFTCLRLPSAAQTVFFALKTM